MQNSLKVFLNDLNYDLNGIDILEGLYVLTILDAVDFVGDNLDVLGGLVF